MATNFLMNLVAKFSYWGYIKINLLTHIKGESNEKFKSKSSIVCDDDGVGG